MSVRAFAPADAPAWVELTNRVLGRNTAPGRLLADDARAASQGIMRRWLLTDIQENGGEDLDGVARLNFSSFAPPAYLEAQIVVRPEARHKGNGQTLWREIRQSLTPEVRGLMSDVADNDPGSLAWAERRGFQRTVHRFASELELAAFDQKMFAADLESVRAQGITFQTLSSADEATMQRYLNLVADLLLETPDLAGRPRWSGTEVRAMLHLDREHPRLEWLTVAVSADGEWLGTTAMVNYGDLAYNEFTATTPAARGRRLALPLKLHAIAQARAAGLRTMRTNNHSQNAPMLAVNRKLGFVQQTGKYELHLAL